MCNPYKGIYRYVVLKKKGCHKQQKGTRMGGFVHTEALRSAADVRVLLCRDKQQDLTAHELSKHLRTIIG